MDSVSEKLSRISDRIAMVGLILSIIKIPAFKKDSRFRSGQLSNQVNYIRASGLEVSFFAPGRTVFQGPIKQSAFKTDVVASFLALDPFVTKDLLAFG
jgi:hypothetical protein